MPFTDNSFDRLSFPIMEESERLQLRILQALSDVGETLADNPDTIIRESQTLGEARTALAAFEAAAITWTDKELVQAYRRGIEHINGRVAALGVETGDGEIGRQLFTRGFNPMELSEEILEDWPQHRDVFSMMKNGTMQDFENMRFPVLRDTQDKIRELTIEASRDVYRNADKFTRRDLTQSMLNRFADEGITGIRYADGRTMNVDSYAEMVARTQSGNAARQGAVNRQVQLGEDLMRMSTHYPCSDLCIGWQGGVYSISGNSEQYPALDTAISGGAFHSNCKHSLSPYYPGISPAQDTRDISKTENKEMYQAQRRQREIERKIRKYKARKASAISEQAEERAQKYISKWQKQQRLHIENNSFLRRQYSREQI